MVNSYLRDILIKSNLSGNINFVKAEFSSKSRVLRAKTESTKLTLHALVATLLSFLSKAECTVVGIF